MNDRRILRGRLTKADIRRLETYATVLVEDDCEDQGFSLLSEGCLRFECQTWEPGAEQPTHPELVKEKRHGKWWWVCPKCHGFYGEVR